MFVFMNTGIGDCVPMEKVMLEGSLVYFLEFNQFDAGEKGCAC